jgi:hypothetical protein
MSKVDMETEHENRKRKSGFAVCESKLGLVTRAISAHSDFFETPREVGTLAERVQ